MEQREILLEQILKVLKDVETNTCDKEFVPNTEFLDKKLDRIIDLHQEQVTLLKMLTADRCTCGKHGDKHKKKEKKEKGHRK